MNRCLTTFTAATVMCVLSGCNQIPLFSASPFGGPPKRGEWTMARSPQGVQQAAQPVLVVPSAENPAEESVFAEIERLQDSNEELQTSVDQAVAANEQTRATLTAKIAELSAARTELTDLHHQVEQLSRDMSDWRQEVAQMHDSLYDQQQNELETLDNLIITVQAIVDSMSNPRAMPVTADESVPVSASAGPAARPSLSEPPPPADN